jgi:hypothetical protein
MTSAAPAGKSATTPIQAVSSTPPSSAQPVPSPSLPEATTPPPKRIRRRHNEVELLRGLEGDDDELLLSPLSGVASLPSFSLPSPSSRHTPPTTSPPVLPPVPLNREPVSPTLVPPSLPTFPASPPPVVAPSVGAMSIGTPSPSPSPLPLPSPSPSPPPPSPPSSPSPPMPQPADNTIPPAPPMSFLPSK